MGDVEFYKKMMRQGDTNDYSGGEFVGESGESYRKSTGSLNKKKWGKTKEHVNNDWLGSSPTGARRSYAIKKEVKAPVAHIDDEKQKETTTEEKPKEAPEPAPAPAPSSPVKTEVDPAIAKYKAMMYSGETTDYTSGEYVGESGESYRQSTGSLNKKKWGKTKEHVNNDWLGSSPTGSRRSYAIKKEVKAPVAHIDDEKPKEMKTEEKPKEAPEPEPAPSSPVKTEVDPAIAKYKAMMYSGETTDYTSGEYVGEQSATYGRSKVSPNKHKWGKPSEPEQFRSDEWLGSPGSGRKSYTIKKTAIKPPQVYEDSEKPKETTTEEKPKEAPEPAPSSPVKTEVDPAIAKYKAMMYSGETTDYTSGEYVGDSGESYRKSTGSLNKKKWGKTKEHVNNDWLGSNSSPRKSYTVKSSIKPPVVHDEKAAPSSPTRTAAPSSPTRAAVSSSPTKAASDNVSSPVKEKEKMARGSFAAAFAAFDSPAGKTPSQRNFRVSKDARALDGQTGSQRGLGDSVTSFNDMSGTPLDDDGKKELDETVGILRNIFGRLDDREWNYGEMQKIIKKLEKVAVSGNGAKSALENVIPRLEHLERGFYDADLAETKTVVDKLHAVEFLCS